MGSSIQSFAPIQSFASPLEQAKVFLSPALVPHSGVEQSLRVARLLPAFAIDFFGFEVRLGPASEAADCAFNLTRDGAKLLAGQHAIEFPASLASSAWQKIHRFYRDWANTRDVPFRDAGATWLEFDSSQSTPHPNLLFGYWPDNPTAQRPLDWLTGSALPMLLGTPLSARWKSNLERCFAAHSGAGDFQIGVMLARPMPTVRVCVFDIAPGRAPAYLDAIGWPGPRASVQGYLEALAPHADFLALHLDVGEVVFPTIGVEPGFTAGPWARQPHYEPRWHRQFEQLVAFGLCTEQKRAALLEWVGYGKCDDPAFAGQVLLRGLSHVKLSLRIGQPAVAKAYFGLALRSPKSPDVSTGPEASQ
jgi:hypothetical protein